MDLGHAGARVEAGLVSGEEGHANPLDAGAHQRPRPLLVVEVTLLAAAFLAVQGHALVGMLAEHRTLLGHEVSLYGLLFVLVALHAVHVLGGLPCHSAS